jgi:DNA-binding GntR family transcriptional regulator
MAQSGDRSVLDYAPLRRAEPLREAVYARVVQLVNDGYFPPGAPLTEAQIGRALGVSRTPVREALLRLASEGVLDNTLAKGFTIRPLSAQEARQLYPILGTLEALAVRSIRDPKSSTLRQLTTICRRHTSESEPLKRWRLDNEFHSMLVSISENDSLMALIGQLRTNLSRYEITYVLNIPSMKGYGGQHQHILELVKAGDVDAAADLVSSHWQEGMELVLGWLDGGVPRAADLRATVELGD